MNNIEDMYELGGSLQALSANTRIPEDGSRELDWIECWCASMRDGNFEMAAECANAVKHGKWHGYPNDDPSRTGNEPGEEIGGP